MLASSLLNDMAELPQTFRKKNRLPYGASQEFTESTDHFTYGKRQQKKVTARETTPCLVPKNFQDF